MRDETKSIIIIGSSMIIMTILTGILITATGKALVLEVDGISGKREESDGTYQENHVDGGRFKFYAE